MQSAPPPNNNQPNPHGASWSPDPATVAQQQQGSGRRPWYLDLAYIVGWTSFLVAIVFGIFAAVSPLITKAISPATELQIFGSVYDDAVEEMTPSDHETAAYLQDMVDRLAVHWEDNPYDLRVAVLHEEAPNAMAVPGGTILVTTGLLEMAGSENELAFVIGHELGHFYHRHSMKRIGRSIAWMVAVYAIAGEAGAFLAPGGMRTISRLMERGFGRSQESQSDRFGLDLVHAEYGHIGGATNFFSQLPDVGSGTLGRVASYMSTHPLSEDRIAAMHSYGRENNYETQGHLTPLPEFVTGRARQ